LTVSFGVGYGMLNKIGFYFQKSISTGESAWEYDNERREYYLHQFGKDQPDLNLHNEDVRAELEVIYQAL